MKKNNFVFTVELDLLVGHYCGQSMSLKIMLDDTILEEHIYLPNKQYKFKFETRSNQTLTIMVDGKKINDTKIDENHNILEDKFIKVNQFVINHIPMPRWVLENGFFQFENFQGQISNSNYFGQNGKTQICLGDSVLKFFLHVLSK